MATLRLGRVVLLSSVLGVAFGCNAILGIDEPKLVEDNGSGGKSGSGGEGSGGDESGGTDGGGNTTGSGGTSSGGRAGSGGKASGGSSSGGGSSGGAPGSGGKASGGSQATGGTTDAGPPAPPGVPGQVRCGTESCRIAGGSGCCVDTATGDDPHCSATCDSTSQTRYACDGAEDCDSARPVCCLAVGSNTAQCSANCTGRVICGAHADCAPGQGCAPGTNAFEVVSICTKAPTKDFVWCDNALCDRAGGKACCFDKNTNTASCTADCPADDIKHTCDDTTDCPNGQLCCETRTGLGVLTGTSCQASCAPGATGFACGSAANCAAGEMCCLTAAGSAACAASCASITLCGTDADCSGSCTLVTAALPVSPTGKSRCGANDMGAAN